MTERVVAYIPDLMDRSRLGSRDIEFVPSLPLLTGAVTPTSTVLLDLARPGVLDLLDQLVADSARVIAFVPHVEDELAALGLASGAEVVARSRFFRDLDGVLATD